MNKNSVLYVLGYLLLFLFNVSLYGESKNASVSTKQKIVTTLGNTAQTIKDKVYQAGITVSKIPGKIKETVSSSATAAGDFCVNLLPRKDIVEILQQVTSKDPFSDRQASVRRGTTLPLAEINYLQARKEITKAALEKLVGRPLTDKQVPRIAFAFSGGGYRAMIETLGGLKGAEKTGLLDATTYITGLSGSTWAINPWILSGQSVASYLDSLKTKINKAIPKYLPTDKESIKQLVGLILRKNLYSEHIGLTDFYGALLANTLLQNVVSQKQFATLSALVPKVETGAYPLPLSTAVLGTPGKSNVWFEFSPFEIGSDQEKAFIPTWSFGRKFSNGFSVLVPSALSRLPSSSTVKNIALQQQPQQTLGYLMGTWGSAFAFDFTTVIRVFLQLIIHDCGLLKLINPQLAKELIQLSKDAQQAELLEKKFSAVVRSGASIALGTSRTVSLTTARLGAAKVFNFIPQQENTLLPLVDGGYDQLVTGERLNIAILPLLAPKRAVDLIIILDSSGDLEGAPALKAAEVRAKALGLPFPAIPSYKDIARKPLSVFSSTTAGVPTIIYMPAIKNNAYDPTFDPLKVTYTSTPNFNYKPQETDKLSGLTQFIFEQQHKAILDVIEKLIAKKALLINN